MLKFITGNKNKFKEVQRILAPIKVRQIKIDLTEIQGLDPKKIIQHKLREAFKHHQGEFIIEDVSVYLHCLGDKLPGPLIKWFYARIGNQGMINLTNKMGNNKAVVQNVIAYAKNPKTIKFFTGVLHVEIVSPKGNSGFEWDPIFQPKGQNRTLGQIKKNGKYSMTARGIAAKKLKAYLVKHESK